MKKQVYIHTSCTFLFTKKFVEPLALALNHNKYHVEVWIDPFLEYFDYRTEFSFPVKLLDLRINLNLIRCLVSLYRLYKLFKKTKPCVVETHTTVGSLLPLIAAKISGIERRIYHNHGIPFVGYKGMLKWILYFLELLNCCFASDVITVSKGMLRIYSNMFPANFNVRLPNPGSACGLPESYYVDLESMMSIKSAKKEKNGFSDEIIFMYVGRSIERKGLLIAIQAFELYNQKFRNSKLFLAGCSKKDLMNRGISNQNIIPLGFVVDLSTNYLISDVVLLPSIHEGFGYSLLEGAANGNALISSDIPGPDDMVLNGITGYRIEVGSTVSMKEAMIRLSENRSLLGRMQYNARVHAACYSRDIVINNYLKLVNG